MTISERAELAKSLKATGMCNCTQAVLKAFEDVIDIKIDDLMKAGAGFAAGMGCMESTCGGLIGAVITAGFLTQGKGTPAVSKKLLQYFNDKSGATLCKVLKGVDTGTVLCQCPDCVYNAVMALGEAGLTE